MFENEESKDQRQFLVETPAELYSILQSAPNEVTIDRDYIMNQNGSFEQGSPDEYSPLRRPVF